MRRAHITDLRWHDLRRSAGCRWLQRDHKTSTKDSILLGHSSVLVTEARYAFLEEEAVQQIAVRPRPHENRHRNSGHHTDCEGAAMINDIRTANYQLQNLG